MHHQDTCTSGAATPLSDAALRGQELGTQAFLAAQNSRFTEPAFLVRLFARNIWSSSAP